MRVLIADDHPLYREAIRLRLERSYMGVEIIELADLNDLDKAMPGGVTGLDLILLDYHMPGISNNDSLCQAIQKFKDIPTVLISGLARREDVKAAIAAGARGFMTKTMTAEQFSAALSLVLCGGTYMPAEMIADTEEQDSPASRSGMPEKNQKFEAQLTPRELQILAALAVGAPNKQIARDFELAEVTVKLHLRQIFRKIGARNRAEAAVIASKAGLV